MKINNKISTNITIKDIAKLSSVSIATVSMIVNGKDDRISKETRKRVLDIVKKHNYVPNRNASSLVTNSTKSLGLILPDISNPFFPEIARGVEDFANKNGWSVILCNSDNNEEKENKYLELLLEKKVDGIILSAASERRSSNKLLQNLNIPIVSVDRENKYLPNNGSVIIDNSHSSFEAVSHMIARGYKKIIHLSGQMNLHTAQERYLGYLKAHEDSEIELLNIHHFEGEYTAEFGERITQELLDKSIEFDGLFCGNDLIAIGAIKTLKRYGLSIPNEVGLVGFDDIYLGRLFSPELTTVHQPIYELGFKSAEMLIDIIETKNFNQLEKKVLLKSHLIERETTR